MAHFALSNPAIALRAQSGGLARRTAENVASGQTGKR
jgi:hypothetical protein